jgi:DNA-binding transcriptional ArsR family regulator
MDHPASGGRVQGEQKTDGAELVRVLAALSDENRYRIVKLLAANVEMACGAIGAELGLSASLVSHHLSILESVGLIDRRKNGLWTLNRLCRDELSRHVDALESLLRPDAAPNPS